MTSFSFLEKDKKTFNYIKKYLDFMEQETEKSTLALENAIQVQEIEEHLTLLEIPIGDYSKRNSESFNWIKNNGEQFRMYLNTIKIAAIIFYCRDMDCIKIECEIKKFTFDNFCRVVDDINKIKFNLIDTVF